MERVRYTWTTKGLGECGTSGSPPRSPPLRSPAGAQTLRDSCGDRPGITIAPCTVDPGHLQVELGLADWTRETDPDSRTDRTEGGQLLLRYGAGPSTELRLAWVAVGHERERDRETGEIDRATRTGDVTLGLKQTLRAPDGSGLSIALLPRVILPAGREPIGRGTWAANLVMPVSYEIAKDYKLTLNPRVDAAANESGHGRHLAYSGAAGIEAELIKELVLDLEVQSLRGRDPGGHQTEAFAGIALDYTIAERTQFDIGTTAGLNRDSPDIEVYCGVSRNSRDVRSGRTR